MSSTGEKAALEGKGVRGRSRPCVLRGALEPKETCLGAGASVAPTLARGVRRRSLARGVSLSSSEEEDRAREGRMLDTRGVTASSRWVTATTSFELVNIFVKI